MAPIRVGIIGLASKDSPQFANGEWGVKHFKALQHLPAYEVVAVCNSTLESSTRSIAFHKLDPSVVRAYGSPKDLAADPNVDLVVVTVSAKYHLDLAKPAIEAGKDVYVEFPLAPSVAEAEELYELAKKKGVKTIAGTQAVSEPVMVKLRELISEIGEVVNTVMVGASPLDVSMGWPEDAAGLLELNHEVSRIVIVLGHCE
jgi:predicted dehydrogenase